MNYNPEVNIKLLIYFPASMNEHVYHAFRRFFLDFVNRFNDLYA